MRKSIFDSKSEKKIYKRLNTFWSKYSDIFPQIPVKNVVDFEKIKQFAQNQKQEDYLLKTSFDFVICELNTGSPLLVVEFDGLTGGFSYEGKFYQKSRSDKDKYRKLKMQTKLDLCSEFQIPMIVVSYNESNVLPESGDWISVLDVIIGDSIEKRHYQKNIGKYIQMLTEAYEFGGDESAEITGIEIDTINEFYNPVKRKIKNITKEFPFWPLRIVFPKTDDGMLFGKFKLTAGLKTVKGTLYSKNLLEVDLRIREVNQYESDSLFLFNTIGEYCLARKAEREIGNNTRDWQKLFDNTKWTKYN